MSIETEETPVRGVRVRAPGGAQAGRHFCSLPAVAPPALRPDLAPERARAIIVNANKWVNGTVIRYYLYDRQGDGAWGGDKAQKQVVRDAFAKWKGLGIGLDFKEVSTREEAEVRIGFLQGDGSWSYIGTYVLKIGPGERTMNFGWDLRGDPDTALHEIGHTLGLPHEHQNPNAGIVWNEEAVYAALAGPPNYWDREKTYYNIIRKLSPAEVQGSTWDPDSVMHYPFDGGLILQPPGHEGGLHPAGGLSPRDVAWVRSFYPPLDAAQVPALRPGQSQPLAATSGEQRDFVVVPDATRSYQIRTFGACDTVAVLFEDQGGDLRHLAADDDSGEDRNASLAVKLFKGRRYVLRVRMKYSDDSSPPSVMMW